MEQTACPQRSGTGFIVLAGPTGDLFPHRKTVAHSHEHGRLRFAKPAFMGDTIHSRATAAAGDDDPERPATGGVVVRTESISQYDDVGLVTDHIHIIERKQARLRRARERSWQVG
jgi:acyl dehydratase